MVGRELLTICPHGEDHPARDRGEREIRGIGTTDSAGVSGVDWRRYTRRMTTTTMMITTTKTTIIVHMIAIVKKWRWHPMQARSSDLMPAPSSAPAGPATAQLPPLMIPCRWMMRWISTSAIPAAECSLCCSIQTRSSCGRRASASVVRA